MNVFNYVDKYGNKTFKEKSLNEIDKLIFALLSYVPYNGCVPNNDHHKRRIEDVGEQFFKENSNWC